MGFIPPDPGPLREEPQLEYRPPEKGPPNGVGWFLLRMLAGFGFAIAALVTGSILVGVTNIVALFWVPVVLAVLGAGYLSFRWKRYGYLTGVLVAPLIIAVGLAVLLFAICGGMGTFR